MFNSSALVSILIRPSGGMLIRVATLYYFRFSVCLISTLAGKKLSIGQIEVQEVIQEHVSKESILGLFGKIRFNIGKVVSRHCPPRPALHEEKQKDREPLQGTNHQPAKLNLILQIRIR
jgi:hypothetical protein